MPPRFPLLCALGLVLAAAAGRADDPGAASRKALKEIEGVYALTAMEVGGVKAKEEFVRDRRFLVRADARGYQLVALTTARVGGADRVIEEPLRITADPSKKPAAIEFEESTEDGKARTTFGIYKLENDVLTICASDTQDPANRPTDFTTSPAHPKQYLLVLKRLRKGP